MSQSFPRLLVPPSCHTHIGLALSQATGPALLPHPPRVGSVVLMAVPNLTMSSAHVDIVLP